MFTIPHEPQDLYGVLIGFMLVLARFSGFFAVSPLFSRKVMPRSVRLGVIVAMGFISGPVVIAEVQMSEGSPSVYAFLVLKELGLGYLLGNLIWLPLRGLELAGVILDTQRGSTQAQDLDVVFGAQTTPTAIFLSQVFAAYFFSAGGFLIVLSMLFESMKIWPPVAHIPPISENAAILYIRFAGMMFFSATIIVLPISSFMFLADIVIAFLARSAQSLNALTFGMPVKSAVLLVMLIFYLEIIYPKLILTLSSSIKLMIKVLAQ
jgi:type III secretion protein T